jgi:molybdopterin-guanine dinucleotide biosynthesis protein A
MPSFSAALLLGGESSRMGRDKALLPLPGSGQLLWHRQLGILEGLHPEALYWSGTLRAGVPDHVRVIEDKVNKAGPLAGISACLDAISTDLLVVLAIDLPDMTTAFLQRLLAACSANCGVVASRNGFLEPLAAVYPKRLQALAGARLEKGHLALKDFIAEAQKQNEMEVIPLTQADHLFFRNLNTPNDI